MDTVWEFLSKASVIMSIVSFFVGFISAKIHTRIRVSNTGKVDASVNKKNMTINGDNNNQFG